MKAKKKAIRYINFRSAYPDKAKLNARYGKGRPECKGCILQHSVIRLMSYGKLVGYITKDEALARIITASKLDHRHISKDNALTLLFRLLRQEGFGPVVDVFESVPEWN